MFEMKMTRVFLLQLEPLGHMQSELEQRTAPSLVVYIFLSEVYRKTARKCLSFFDQPDLSSDYCVVSDRQALLGV